MGKEASIPTRRILNPIFGQPELDAGGNGSALWTTTRAKGVSQVVRAVLLNGGTQTGSDFAKVLIPVDELPFTELTSVRLHAYYTQTSGIDMAVCVYMHNPSNFDDRIELSHTPYTTSAAGWRELNFPTEPGGASWFWYGTKAGTPDTCPLDGGSATYTWAQFQADSVFRTWTIYKISLDYGYYSTGTMDGCYLVQALINNQTIPLEPPARDHIGSEVKTLTAKTGGTPTTVATLVTGVTARKIRVISVNCSSMSSVGAEFEVYFVAGTNMDTTPANAIFAASLVANATATYSTSGTASQSWPDGAGPVGGIGEAVAIRTSADIGTGGRVTIVYREE